MARVYTLLVLLLVTAFTTSSVASAAPATNGLTQPAPLARIQTIQAAVDDWYGAQDRVWRTRFAAAGLSGPVSYYQTISYYAANGTPATCPISNSGPTVGRTVGWSETAPFYCTTALVNVNGGRYPLGTIMVPLDRLAKILTGEVLAQPLLQNQRVALFYTYILHAQQSSIVTDILRQTGITITYDQRELLAHCLSGVTMTALIAEPSDIGSRQAFDVFYQDYGELAFGNPAERPQMSVSAQQRVAALYNGALFGASGNVTPCFAQYWPAARNVFAGQ